MLGETTKSQNNNCFADTNVYIDYALDFKYYDGAAEKYFQSGHSRFTSVSVDKEIGFFREFTITFGVQLDNALARGRRKDVVQRPRIVFTRFNESRYDLIEEIIKKIKNHDALGMSSEYRAFKRLIWARLEEAKNIKTNQPLEKQSTDTGFINSLSYIKDVDDQQIIADAALWASKYDFAIFCTSDREHILSNEAALTPHVAKYLTKKCLSFKHVKDIVV